MNSLEKEPLVLSRLAKISLFLLAVFVIFFSTLIQAADPDEFIVWSNTVPGRLYVPENYNASQSYPLVIFFHGLGEKGTDNTKQVNNNINNLFAECKVREAFLYAPQSSTGWWNDSTVGKCMEMVREAIASYNIDDKRVYATGLSAGGQGVYNTMEVHHNSVAAAVPICAAGSGERDRDDRLVGFPIWFFHAADDPTVIVSQTRKAINGIREEDWRTKLVFPLNADPDNPYYNTGSPYYSDGTTFFDEGNIRYTEYYTGGHGIWGRVYNEEWMYDWLFSHSLPTSPVNRAPEVDAGRDQKLIMPMNQISVKATYLDDGLPHPPTLTLNWSKVSGPGTVTFKRSTKVSTTATFSSAGTYVIRFSVSDGELTGYDEITVTVNPPMPDGQLYVISPLTAGTAIGSDSFLLNYAFDRQPNWDATNQIPVGGVEGSRAPAYTLRQGCIDFGPSWEDIRIIETWTQYLSGTTGNQSAYEAMWWDDDNDNVNDSGLNENILNFNSAQNLTSSSELLWIQDVDCSSNPITPKGRYLILSTPATTTNRATEYAFVGYMQTENPENIAPTVDAGSDQTITLPTNSVNLNGAVIDDGLPTAAVSSQWSKVSGLGEVTFSNPNTLNTAVNFAIAGTYILRLTANDSELQSSDDVAITVNPAPVYTLMVNSGSGDGDYEEGEVITIQADAIPAGQKFDIWTGDIANLADPSSAITTMTMPAGNVIITANYKEQPADNELMVDLGGNRQTLYVNYNNLKGTSSARSGQIADLIDQEGNPTGFKLVVTDAFNSTDITGSTEPDSALNIHWKSAFDSFYGNTVLYNGETEPTAEVVFSQLNPDLTYSFTFFASVLGVSENRETKYTVTGAAGSQGVALLEPVDNTGNVAVVENITPNAANEISILIEPGPGNDSTYGFYHLGFIRMAFSAENPEIAVADAGPDQEINLPTNSATLNGTDSVASPGQTITSYKWEQINGPAAATSPDWAAANALVEDLVAGIYTFQLTVNDSDGNTATDETNVTVIGLQPPSDTTIHIDLGTKPASEGNYNCLGGVNGPKTGTLDNMIDTNGNATGINFAVTDSFYGTKVWGAVADPSLGISETAAVDAFWGTVDGFGQDPNPTAAFSLFGMDPTKQYVLTFFSSYDDTTENIETEFTITGANTSVLLLDAANNTSETVSTDPIHPDASGNITVSLTAGPANTHSGRIFLLNYLRIEGME